MLLLLSPCRGGETYGQASPVESRARWKKEESNEKSSPLGRCVYRGESVVGIQIDEEAFCRWTLLIIQGKTVAERTRVPPTGHAKSLSDRFN